MRKTWGKSVGRWAGAPTLRVRKSWGEGETRGEGKVGEPRTKRIQGTTRMCRFLPRRVESRGREGGHWTMASDGMRDAGAPGGVA